MALKDIWKDLENAVEGVAGSGSDISADNINDIAHAVIDLENNAPSSNVPTKMSELEQDLKNLDIGGTKYTADGITNPNQNGYFGINTYITSINGGYVYVHNLVEPTSDKDAANKGYVDGLVGDIETALDGIIALQNTLIGGETV